jgi:hypothetical protein
MKKLDVHKSVDLATLAVREGLVAWAMIWAVFPPDRVEVGCGAD